LQKRRSASAWPAAGITALEVPDALFFLEQLPPPLLGLLFQAGGIVFKDGGRRGRLGGRT
jgi:hypothetical protein